VELSDAHSLAAKVRSNATHWIPPFGPAALPVALEQIDATDIPYIVEIGYAVGKFSELVGTTVQITT
jgi:hypothetical protein